MLNFQGRIVVAGTNFTGTGQFKFALVNGAGGVTLWSNDGTSTAGSQPAAAVPLTVSKGLYAVALGDTSEANMTALPASAFSNSDVRLRVWFSDGIHGFELLSPDQRVTAVGYALQAQTVPDGAITAAKLDPSVTAQTASLSSQVAALSARLSTDETLLSQVTNSAGNPSSSSLPTVAASTDPQDPTLLFDGFQLFTSIAAPGWVTGSATGAPSPAVHQAGTWTGTELLVWGGGLVSGGELEAGDVYRPDLDQWQRISTLNAPTGRERHTAVWDGSEMIVWGGTASGAYLNTGGRYNPSTETWTATSTNGAPSPRAGQIAVWTGSRMLIWGGQNEGGLLGDGALYDPATDQWTPLSLPNAPSPRTGAVGVWAGGRLIVWGGQDEHGPLNTGAQLVFAQSGQPLLWASMSVGGAPYARTGETAVWTGQRLVIWGGLGTGGVLGDGAAYNPNGNTWSLVSTTGAPSARSGHAGVWTGTEMLIFGGETASGTAGDGAAYNPLDNTWRALTASGGPQARSGAVAAWSGTELLLFGGLSQGAPLDSLQRLNPQPTWYLFRKL